MDRIINSIGTEEMYNYMNNIIHPSIFTIIIIVVLIIILFSYLGKNDTNTNINDGSTNTSSGIFMTIFILFIFLILIMYGYQYYFGTSINASLNNIFSNNQSIDIKVNKTNKMDEKDDEKDKEPEPANANTNIKQVFNIPGNYYNYDDAKTLCAAYNSRLATYEEIEKAYNEGGEWCNYGWSEGQMALFPTQKTTFANLQQIKGHENDCGRPGINGGFMNNTAIKYGVNCYGVKPTMTEEERLLMEVTPLYPKTVKDKYMEERIEYWRQRLNQILVSPFNKETWSKI